jgi:hypothetical protein
MPRPTGLFRYVVLGAVAGLDLALWVALVGKLFS